MRRPYKHYRLVFDESVGNSSYTTVNEIEAYTDRGVLSGNKLSTATLTSNGQYQTQFASFANDGDLSTYWESISATPQNKAWLSIELNEPQELLVFKITSTAYPSEKPKNFKVFSSDDGASWVEIAQISNFLTPSTTDASFHLWTGYSGYSTLDDGSASSLVALVDWDTLQTLDTKIPQPDGYYQFYRQNYTKVMIVHKGPIGYKPICDGPIEWGEM